MDEKLFHYGIRVERIEGGEWAVVGSAESIIRVLEAMLRYMGKALRKANTRLIHLEESGEEARHA